MAITAAMVKELRETTGAGMLDCKKALEECAGDMAKSVEFLREKGLAKAAKKAGRIAAEGLVSTAVTADGKKAVVVEVNSETDFVAKNEDFIKFVGDVTAQALATGAADIDAFLAEAWSLDASKTVKEALSEKIAVIGENLNIRRFAQVTEENGFVANYIHAAGRIGVLVQVETTKASEAVKAAARNVAMQIAAITPLYVDSSEVSADYIAKEKEILKQQAINENPGKPEAIIEKMIGGRLQKQLKEVCLLDQTYVKDSELTVAKYLESVAKAEGTTIKVVKFVRFETGEGIEKVEENFAEEVAKQMGLN